jgi:hypothetical protein
VPLGLDETGRTARAEEELFDQRRLGSSTRAISLDSRHLIFVPISEPEVADVLLISLDQFEVPAGKIVLSELPIRETSHLTFQATTPSFISWNDSRMSVSDGERLVVCGYPNEVRFPDFQAIRATRLLQIRAQRPAEETLFGDVREGFSVGRFCVPAIPLA